MKKVSIITVNYNGLKHLEYSIPSLLHQNYNNFEIIVVDNASTDGSIEFLEKKFPKITLIKNKRNEGPVALDRGIKIAKGDYILLCGNDTKFENNFLSSLVKTIEKDKKIGMVQPRILLKKTGKVNTLGLRIFASGRAQDIIEERNTADIICPCGCAELLRKSALEEIKQDNYYFDQDFFWGCEDLDLGLRLTLKGYDCVYDKNAKMLHVHGGTMPSTNDFAIYQGDRNRIWTIIKNFPTKLLWTNILSILLLQIATIVKYTLKGKFILIIRSKLDAIKGFKKMFKKRKYIQKNRAITDQDLLKKFSKGII